MGRAHGEMMEYVTPAVSRYGFRERHTEKPERRADMAKYIEREELVEWIKRIPLKDLSDGLGLCRVIMEEDFKRAIRTIPAGTIIDVDPVVRCRECKQGEVDDPDFPDQYYCHAGCGWNKGDFYCAYGERKEGAENG